MWEINQIYNFIRKQDFIPQFLTITFSSLGFQIPASRGIVLLCQMVATYHTHTYKSSCLFITAANLHFSYF